MLGGFKAMGGQALHPIPHNDCVVDGVGVVYCPRVLSHCLLPARGCVAQKVFLTAAPTQTTRRTATPAARCGDGTGMVILPTTPRISTPLETWKCFDRWPELFSTAGAVWAWRPATADLPPMDRPQPPLGALRHDCRYLERQHALPAVSLRSWPARAPLLQSSGPAPLLM